MYLRESEEDIGSLGAGVRGGGGLLIASAPEEQYKLLATTISLAKGCCFIK